MVRMMVSHQNAGESQPVVLKELLDWCSIARVHHHAAVLLADGPDVIVAKCGDGGGAWQHVVLRS